MNCNNISLKVKIVGTFGAVKLPSMAKRIKKISQKNMQKKKTLVITFKGNQPQCLFQILNNAVNGGKNRTDRITSNIAKTMADDKPKKADGGDESTKPKPSKEELVAEQQAAKEQLQTILDTSRPKHLGYGISSGVSNIVAGAVGAVGVAILAPVVGTAMGAKQAGVVGGTVGLVGGAIAGVVGGAAMAVGGAVQGVTQVSVYLCLYNIYILWKLSIRYMGVVISSSFDCCIVFICVYMMIL